MDAIDWSRQAILGQHWGTVLLCESVAERHEQAIEKPFTALYGVEGRLKMLIYSM